MNNTVNIAAYKFVSLDDLPALRDTLESRCLALNLKGTILLAPEGINLCLSGSEGNVATLKNELHGDARLTGISFKESWSDAHPFGKLLVKIKQEIIPFGRPEVNPAKQPAERLSARTLKVWLDEGRDIVLLDTRNTFEIKRGTFKNAADFTIDHFRNFPSAVEHANPSLKEKTIVTFCTGGIRCEKAAPYLIQQGYKRVYQLDGGILKYFEACGKAHFDGDCFVFDERVALNAELKPIDTN